MINLPEDSPGLPAGPPAMLQPVDQRTHSVHGIVSLVAGCLSVMGLCAGFAANLSSPRQEFSSRDEALGYYAARLGCDLMMTVFPALVGLVAGILGLRLRDRKKGLAVAGTAISGGMLLLMVALLILGLVFVLVGGRASSTP